MKRFREIIQDNTAPSTSDLWITNGKMKYFDGGWKDLGREQVLWDDIQEKPEFAEVATTGSYSDLSDKPTIPSAYTLPIATASVLGGVKSATTGTTPERDYSVEINADGTMKVNVPWVDLNTTYTKATDTILGLVMIGYTENDKNYPVELDENGKMFVNVPWIDTNTTYSVASNSSDGLMSSTDKSKLDNIAENANNYTLPDATSFLRGGVLMGVAVPNITIDGTETASTVATTVNALLASLRAAGVLNP